MKAQQNIGSQSTSSRKTQSNREDAKKSTGPQTAAGKAVVRGNAIKHALLTSALKFDTRQQEEDYKQLRAAIRKELRPVGIVETMLVEEIIVSWWKQQAAQRWSLEGLSCRRRASIQILRACGADLSRVANNTFDEVDDAAFIAGSGWDCDELLIKVGAEKEGPQTLFPKPDVQFEAKLGTSADNCLRYEAAWKKDMYRAMEMLKNIQQARLAKSGGAKA